MAEDLIETVRAFDAVYQRLFSDEERPEKFDRLRSWIKPKGGIPSEVQAMDNLLILLEGRNPERIREYVESNECNTFSCGFYEIPVEGYPHIFHNETIPDHFRKILRLRDASSMPFAFIEEEGVTTPFFEQLQEEARGILRRCHGVKREILLSDERFRGNPQDIDLQVAYLLGEADRLETVQGIAGDMKRVYGVATEIIRQMGK